MRILLDNAGYLKGWMLEDDCGKLSDNDIVIETPKFDDIRQFLREASLYHLVDGKLVKDENKEMPKVVAQPTQLDIIEAQVAYTAMMTGTLLEV
jgi:hypothetical protein